MELETNTQLDSLLSILQEGETTLNLDLHNAKEKVAHAKKTLNDDKLKIVLLSSFSDGKTTIIAALNGKIEANMKIDIDESSDEMQIYHPTGLAHGYVIMDTPGLFGSKTKEVNGETIRLSEMTERYISEAHIILYICDAVTPLKDSHAPFIEKVMRQFGKLESTIFVINKMDEAGVDLSDEDNFASKTDIKKDNLIGRLRDTIGLTEQEQQKLHIVCIAADPYGAGLEHWLSADNYEKYKQISHIEGLRKCIEQVVTDTNPLQLRKSAELASLKDVIGMTSERIDQAHLAILNTIVKLKETLSDNKQDLALLKQDLVNAKKDMTKRLKALKDKTLTEINTATLDTIGEVLNRDLGVQNGKVTFYVFYHDLNLIVKECSEGNGGTIQRHIATIEHNNTSVAKNLASDIFEKGTSLLKNVTISGENIKQIRDVIAKGHKFKPWEAIKMGGKVTKVLNRSGNVIEIAVSIFQRIQQENKKEKLKERKDVLSRIINDAIAEIFQTCDNDEQYYQNYAPAYLELEKQIAERDDKCEQMSLFSDKLKKYQQRLIDWMKENAEDIPCAENN